MILLFICLIFYLAFAVIFRPDHRFQVIVSDLLVMLSAYVTSLSTQHWGLGMVIKVYGVPCLLVSHWVSMIVFLHIPMSNYHTTARERGHTHEGSLLQWIGLF